MSIEKQLVTPLYSQAITPFIKWPGGKTSELLKIQHFSPDNFTGRYIEPFVGAGAVLFGVGNSVTKLANDKCWELIQLFNAAQVGKESGIFEYLKNIAAVWDSLNVYASEFSLAANEISPDDVSRFVLSQVEGLPMDHLQIERVFLERVAADLSIKLARTKKIEIEKGKTLSNEDMFSTLESSVKSSFYMAIREKFNDLVESGDKSDLRVSYFFFLREYAYASMFRYNSRNRFNVPYGGISYNKKSFGKKVDYLFSAEVSEKLRQAKLFSLDFEEFLEEALPSDEDFIFVDPPYDTVFSDYNNEEFHFSDQLRLEKLLRGLPSRIMVVIGHSQLIAELYSKSNYWNIESFEKTYLWNVKSRNDGKTQHLVIRNY